MITAVWKTWQEIGEIVLVFLYFGYTKLSPLDMETASPSVFISYSHDSEEHRDRCYALKTQLKKNGCRCIIDRDEFSPNQGWPRWCEYQIEECEYVLVICTENYYQRYRGKAVYGKGVKYEGFIITQTFYDNNSLNEKFIPVCFEEKDIKYIPFNIKGASYYVISDKEEYNKLLQRIYKEPEFEEIENGSRPNFERKIPPVLFEDRQPSDSFIIEDQSNKYNNQKNESTIIELTIDKDIAEYSAEDQKKLLIAINTLLSVSDVKIRRKRPGSVKLAIELPFDKAKVLLEAVQSGLLDDQKIIDAEILGNTNIWYYQVLQNFGAILGPLEAFSLPNLQRLYLINNHLIEIEVAIFRRKFPECNVILDNGSSGQAVFDEIPIELW